MKKLNDSNNFSKRNASQVNAILSSAGLNCKVENLGDGRNFIVKIENNIKNRFSLKKAGFLLNISKQGDKYISIKAF